MRNNSSECSETFFFFFCCIWEGSLNCWNAHGISLGAQEITSAVASAHVLKSPPLSSTSFRSSRRRLLRNKHVRKTHTGHPFHVFLPAQSYVCRSLSLSLSLSKGSRRCRLAVTSLSYFSILTIWFDSCWTENKVSTFFELPLLLRKILLSQTVSFEDSHKKIFLNRRHSDDVKFTLYFNEHEMN
jgi:hypothetical protein